MDVLLENSQWYVLENGSLGEGVYKMRNDSMTDQCDEIIRKDDKIRVLENNLCHDIMGIPVFEGTHMRTGRRVLFTANEIAK